MKKRRISNWHPEDIKAAIRKKGITLTALALSQGLAEGAVRYALRYPHFDGERAVASCLGVPPCQLWPSRYDTNGMRKHGRRQYRNVSVTESPSHGLKAKAA